MKKILVILLILWMMVIPVAAAEVAPEESTVSMVSGYIKEYAPEILSACTLLASLVLSYLFKKALLPAVKEFIASIKKIIAAYNDKTEEAVSTLTKKLELSEAFNAELLERFTVQEEKINKALNVVEKVMTAQSDSLFNLLVNTNLPSDVKALVATEHKAQMEEIAGLLKDAQ